MGCGGTEPTVTDANLVLGRLGADRFLGGEMQLDVAAAEARACATRSRKPLGIDVTQAADGILRIAATAMSYAVKGVTTERGLDAGDFALFAYGGAGPLHAAAIAREIGIREVIIPLAPGVFSRLRHAVLRPALRFRAHRASRGSTDASFADIERVYRELEDRGPRGDRGDARRSAADRRQARGRHALCRTGASGDGRSAAARFPEAGSRRDQAAFR